MTARAMTLRGGLVALALFPVLAVAQEWHKVKFNGPLWVKDEFYSTDPSATPRYVYVSGGIPTSLRFPSEVDPAGTKLLGGEGHFESLVIGGRTVVLVPIRNLDPSDRFLLSVKLLDGSEFPLTITSSSSAVDGVINFFPDANTPEALRHALEAKTEEVEALKAVYQQERVTGNSVDHALAALLAQDQVSLTPFKPYAKWSLREDGTDVDVVILTRKPNVKGDAGRGKVAVVMNLKNHESTPWELQEVRLATATGEKPWPFALRASADAIPPSSSGRLAVVVDFSTYDPAKNGEVLLLEVFRTGGFREVSAQLPVRELVSR